MALAEGGDAKEMAESVVGHGAKLRRFIRRRSTVVKPASMRRSAENGAARRRSASPAGPFIANSG
jgi:hypothetical protein